MVIWEAFSPLRGEKMLQRNHTEGLCHLDRTWLMFTTICKSYLRLPLSSAPVFRLFHPHHPKILLITLFLPSLVVSFSLLTPTYIYTILPFPTLHPISLSSFQSFLSALLFTRPSNIDFMVIEIPLFLFVHFPSLPHRDN